MKLAAMERKPIMSEISSMRKTSLRRLLGVSLVPAALLLLPLPASAQIWSNDGTQAGWDDNSGWPQPDVPSEGFDAIQDWTYQPQFDPTGPTGSNGKVLRMEVRSDLPPDASGRYHAEVWKYNTASVNTTRYYGWATFLPADSSLANNIVITQWFIGNGPAVMLSVTSDNKLRLKVIHTTTTDADDWWDYLNSGPAFGSWNRFVVLVRWSTGSDGYIKVWRNPTDENSPAALIFHGVTCNESCSGNNVKLQQGVYAASWHDAPPLPNPPQRKAVFHDHMRYGTTFASVLP